VVKSVNALSFKDFNVNQTNFSSLHLHSDLVANLESLGYQSMTPIQAQSLPHILMNSDVIAQAKTGSGKTAAFALGVLNKLKVKQFRIQSLILCPTRELADQVAKEVRRLGRAIQNIKVLTLCGGQPFGPQVGSLEHGAHIIVGTPGRVEEHLRKGNMVVGNLTTLVLDEADRMLDMGFQPSLDAIVDQLPRQRQTLLFSATYPEQIQSIAQRIMSKPVIVQVQSTHDKSTIQQHFYKVSDDKERMTALRLLLQKYQPVSSVVFCNTKRETQAVADELADYGYSALALNGDLDQRERDQALVRFANKSVSVLVATDVAARGLDIEALDAVINYQLPRDEEIHIHRIGRTGRAGSKGIACSLYSEKEAYKIALLEDYLDRLIVAEPLPPIKLLQLPTINAQMETLQIDGGKKQKIRPGDILGALTGEEGVAGSDVGKINIFDHCAYVAVKTGACSLALKKLNQGKLKGRSFRVRRI
jgi:ATP-independent RNA helicase DbpA